MRKLLTLGMAALTASFLLTGAALADLGGNEWKRVPGPPGTGDAGAGATPFGSSWIVERDYAIHAWDEVAQISGDNLLPKKKPGDQRVDGIMTFQVKSTGKCLAFKEDAGGGAGSVNAEPVTAHAWTCDKRKPNQRFRALSDSRMAAVRIVTITGGMCLDASRKRVGDPNVVRIAPCKDGLMPQWWYLPSVDGGYFQFQNHLVRDCLEMHRKGKANGRTFFKAKCNPKNANQLFRLK